MKLKKIGAVLVAATFICTASFGVADAARGGARISVPKVSAPKVSAPKASTPSSSSTSRPNQEYAPSQKASSYKDTAPSTKSNTGTAAATTGAAQSSSGWGSGMRTFGMLAGGMFLGSMLGSMLGFGGTFFSEILGMFFNIILLYAAIKIIMYLLRRVLGGRSNSNANYRTGGTFGGRSRARYDDPDTIDVEPIEDIRTDGSDRVNVKPLGGNARTSDGEYDAHSTADRYRNM